MDFELTELQTELAAGIRRLCRGRFPLERVRAHEGEASVVDRDAWHELGAAGVFNMRLADDADDPGLGLGEAALVFEQLGRSLVPGPLVPSHLAADLVDGAGNGTTVVGLVEAGASGSKGPASGSAPLSPSRAPLVVDLLADLDVLLVVTGSGVSAVEPSSVSARRLDRPLDPLTPVWVIDELPPGTLLAGEDVVSRWRRDGAVLTAAFQVGLAGWATDLAVDYAKQRHQFGRPIGSFQAVKHLCADMAVRAELARCAVQAAAVTADQPEVGDADAAAAGAKLLADEAAVTNGRACIQVHGGMGFTWEVPAHLAAKRARVLTSEFGTADTLAEVVADLLAGEAACQIGETAT